MNKKTKKYASENFTSLGILKKDKEKFNNLRYKYNFRYDYEFFSAIIKIMKDYKPELKEELK